jgi:hypothetical protein
MARWCNTAGLVILDNAKSNCNTYTLHKQCMYIAFIVFLDKFCITFTLSSFLVKRINFNFACDKTLCCKNVLAEIVTQQASSMTQK